MVMSDTGKDTPQAQMRIRGIEAARRALHGFAEHLIDAAAHELERLYPDFVGKVRTYHEREDAVATAMEAVPLPDDSEVKFSTYRTLLGQVFDLEMGLDQLEVSALLQGVTPTSPAGSVVMRPGEWWYYHHNLWEITLFAVIERTEEVMKATYRRLRNRYDKAGAKSDEETILSNLAAMKTQAEEGRNAAAHGVYSGRGGSGPVTGIAEGGIWEYLSALRLWIPPNRGGVLEQFADPAAGARRFALIVATTDLAGFGIQAALAQLDTTMAWDRVKGEGSTPVNGTSPPSAGGGP
jgi:hypothetical protein